MSVNSSSINGSNVSNNSSNTGSSVSNSSSNTGFDYNRDMAIRHKSFIHFCSNTFETPMRMSKNYQRRISETFILLF